MTVTTVPGVNIYNARKDKKMSQAAFAERCGLDQTTIFRIEKNRGYQQQTLESIAKVLGITVQELFFPPELQDWFKLTEAEKLAVSGMVKSMIQNRNMLE